MTKVIQAHGANRGAHCAKCKTDHDMEKLQEAIKTQEVMIC